MPGKASRARGNEAENAAVDYLVSKGHTILERNYHSRYGEIDIISTIDEFIVFTEVKYRSNTLFGLPSQAVNKVKQRKIVMTSFEYIENSSKQNEICYRYDVIELFGELKTKDCSFNYRNINHIENAFEALL